MTSQLRRVQCYLCKEHFASKQALRLHLFQDGKKHLLCTHCVVTSQKESIYTRLVAGEVLQVRLQHPLPAQNAAPFTIKRLLLLGKYSVTENSEWTPFGAVGGVIINRRKHRMNTRELQAWCERLELVPSV